MILDIEFRTLTDGANNPARLQVRVKKIDFGRYGYLDDIQELAYRAEWYDWQDVPRIDRIELPEEER